MSSLMKLFLSIALFFGGVNGVMGSIKKSPKLFVFGHNYADTGNTRQDAASWKSPYGNTFPGKPSGRFSDGLISTDFLEKVLGAKSPYLWKTHGKRKLRYKKGMNFAFGGAGVHDSPAEKSTNMSAQVNFLVHLLMAGRVYTFDDITSSDVALLSYSGNDYFGYIMENPKFAAYPAFVQYVMDDIRHALWILDGLLFKNVLIASLPPLGCLPLYTHASSLKSCNESYNELVKLHNKLLKNVVAKLNEEAEPKKKNGQPNFFILDLHNAFMTVLNKRGSSKFKNPLKPCCEGECSIVVEGAKKYTLCDDPKSSFFWDKVNPTQEGWKAIYSVLGNPLSKG